MCIKFDREMVLNARVEVIVLLCLRFAEGEQYIVIEDGWNNDRHMENCIHRMHSTPILYRYLHEVTSIKRWSKTYHHKVRYQFDHLLQISEKSLFFLLHHWSKGRKTHGENSEAQEAFII